MGKPYFNRNKTFGFKARGQLGPSREEPLRSLSQFSFIFGVNILTLEQMGDSATHDLVASIDVPTNRQPLLYALVPCCMLGKEFHIMIIKFSSG